jgi:hypothetical protein
LPLLRLDGDAAGAVRATGEVTRAAQTLNQEFTKVGQSADQIRTQLEKAFNEKPMDTYIRKCDELAQKLNAGKITASQYVEQTERLAQGLNKSGEAHQHAFGSEALADVGRMATEAFGLVEIWKSGTEAITEFAEERKRLAEKDVAGLGSLGQLSAAGGTQADADYARQLHARGIVESDAEGFKATTGFVRAHLKRTDEDYLAALAKDKIVDPTTMGDYAQNLQVYSKSFQGKAGSFQDVEKKIRTAGYDTRLGPEEIALQMSKVAPAAREAGLSDSEALAMYVTQVNRSANKKMAGSETIDLIKHGDTFTGPDAVDYAKEVQRIQGAPTAGERPSLVRTDSRASAAHATEEAKAEYETSITDRTAERENLYDAMLTHRKRITLHRQGDFFGSIDNWGDERMNNKGLLWGLIPPARAIPGTEERQLEAARSGSDRALYPKGFIEKLDAFHARQNKLMERQTEIMESEHRSIPAPGPGRQEP